MPAIAGIFNITLAITFIIMLLYPVTSHAAQQNNSRSTILSNASSSNNGGIMFNQTGISSDRWGTGSGVSRGIPVPCAKSADSSNPDYQDPYACFNDTTTWGQGVQAGSSDNVVYQCQGSSSSTGFSSLGAGFSTNNFAKKDCSESSTASIDPFKDVGSLTMSQISSAMAAAQTSLGQVQPVDTTGLDAASASGSIVAQEWNLGKDRINLSPMFERMESTLADAGSDCNTLSSWNNAAKKRCNKIDEEFSYKLDLDEGKFKRLFHASFAINALTDVNGNVTGVIEGSYDMNYQQYRDDLDPAKTKQDDSCSGTFTVEERADGWYYNGLKIGSPEYYAGIHNGETDVDGAVDPCNNGPDAWE